MSGLQAADAADRITQKHRTVFAADGVVKIADAVSGEWVERILEVAEQQLRVPGDWVSDTNPGATENRLFTSRYRWEVDPVIGEFVFGSGMAQMAAALMESRTARFYFDHLLVKEPRTASPTPWHQDIPYWPFLGKQICSAWVAMTAATVAESSLEFVRGSHHWDSYYAPESFDGKRGFMAAFEGEKMPDVEADRAAYDIVGFDVEPGDALFFSSWLIHGSPGNAGDRRRVALSTRWLGDDAVWHPHPGCDPTVGDADTTARAGEYPADDRRFPLVAVQAAA
ncbi:phytanoyl-CoA dioxygenase family protein [Candidatus Poriferisodalis sp.]|uniref:phytanoyl-CoA dioxygenase family protein n=1 Tax=Candidatus Poriferisodalis sp. TaxID=3101277 RepID=UPI003B02E80D